MTRSEQWINIKEISNRGGGERERRFGRKENGSKGIQEEDLKRMTWRKSGGGANVADTTREW